MSKTVKVKTLQDSLALTNAFQALTKELDVTNEDKVVLYVNWELESVSAVLNLEVASRPFIAEKDKPNLTVVASSYYALTDQTRSSSDMSLTPFTYRLTNLNAQGTSAATGEIIRDSIAIPVADGFLRVRAKTDSATSGGSLTITAQKSPLVR